MKKKLSLPLIGLAQALGLFAYISLVSLIFWQGNNWFGRMDSYLGPILLLTLLVLSCLICALITFSYPYKLWSKKQSTEALKLILYTTLWLISLFFIIFLFLLLS